MTEDQVLLTIGGLALVNIGIAFLVAGVRPVAHVRWLLERRRRGGMLGG